MPDPFCPETSPSGALCGVAASIIHNNHFALDGSSWTTRHTHRPPVVLPGDWLWDRLGIDPERVERAEFDRLLSQYLDRLNRRISYPAQTLMSATFGETGHQSAPMILRPCICCHCTGTTMCWHADEGGCHWSGPGR